MSFIKALVLSHVIFNLNLIIKSSGAHTKLEINAEVNNDVGTGNFGSDYNEEETAESKGILSENVIVCH